ncbi:hypothetical protein L596_015238 [Steinernema carpocapsae]|uniref:DUF4794 domain-containing protein n=1 Tax=Steinernema carpocapsae TaxID=34508 RepID=A0A4V6A320_STECR|nr:hypothetical protein L596_015238 [Steinernema carpocapsae]
MTSSSATTLLALLALVLVRAVRSQQETLLGLPPLPAFFEDDEPETVEKPATTTPKPMKSVNPFTLLTYNATAAQHESKYKGRYDDDGVFHPFDEEISKETKKPQALGAKIQKTEDSAEEEEGDMDHSTEAEAPEHTTATQQPRELHLPIKKLSALRENIHQIPKTSPNTPVPPAPSTSFSPPASSVFPPSVVPTFPVPEFTPPVEAPQAPNLAPVPKIQAPIAFQETPPNFVAAAAATTHPVSSPEFSMIQVPASQQDAEKRGLPALPTHPTLLPSLPEEHQLHRDQGVLQKQSPNSNDDGLLPTKPTAKPLQASTARKTSGSGFIGRRLQPQNRRKITTLVPQTQPPIQSAPQASNGAFELDNKIIEPSRLFTVTRKIQNSHPEVSEAAIQRTTTLIPLGGLDPRALGPSAEVSARASFLP